MNSIHRSLCALAASAAVGGISQLANGAESPPPLAEPIRIICIGDSITQGGRRERDEFTYRWPLFNLLASHGLQFDFIGTRTAGLHPEATWPDSPVGTPFDPDHEGYYGAKTAYVADRLAENLPTLPPPDVALIHLGTNNQKSEDYAADIVQPLERIVALLRARNPRVIVLIGHLNFNDGAALTIRPLVEEMALRLDTAASPVVTVHHYRGWKEKPDVADTDTFDWAHPNPQGQRRMAEAWFAALLPYLPPRQPVDLP